MTKEKAKTIELTPNKIRTVGFSLARKGYDTNEVDNFLEKVASEYETFGVMLNEAYENEWQARKEVKELKKQIERLGNELKEQSSAYSSQAMQVYGTRAPEQPVKSKPEISAYVPADDEDSTMSDALKRIIKLENLVYGDDKKRE